MSWEEYSSILCLGRRSQPRLERVLFFVHHNVKGVRMRVFTRSLSAFLAWGLALLWPMSGFASTPFKQTLTVKQNAYLSDGVFVGGKAGAGATLLGVRRAFSKGAHLERLEKEERNARGTTARW